MAELEPNFSFSTYVDDGGVSWNKRYESGGPGDAVSGHAAAVSSQPLWEDRGKKQYARHVIYQNAANGRTRRVVVFTPTAYAAIALGSVLAFNVRNLATTVNYTAIRKVAERKMGIPAFSHQLAE